MVLRFLFNDYMAEVRVSVDKEALRKVYSELKEEGYTLDEISEYIGSEFRNHLYKGTSFSSESFNLLERLLERDIESQEVNYVDGAGEVDIVDLERNKALAELVGIILGDGHIDRRSYDRGDRYISNHSVTVTLNSSEQRMISHTMDILEKCLGQTPAVNKLGHAEAVNIRVYGLPVVEAFERIGLVSGNKVNQQVSVPERVKEDTEYEKACPRGLVDTDGSIYRRSEDGYVVVYFKNRSEPLLEDFASMSRDIGVESSSAGEHAVQVAAQEDVRMFISKVGPIKSC